MKYQVKVGVKVGRPGGDGEVGGLSDAAAVSGLLCGPGAHDKFRLHVSLAATLHRLTVNQHVRQHVRVYERTSWNYILGLVARPAAVRREIVKL